MGDWRPAGECRPAVRKALEVLLYVTRAVPNTYNALKVLYFADRLHLQRYGRLVYGDSYVAMQHGPVPSLAYDIVKWARGGGWHTAPDNVREARESIAVHGHNITPQREPNVGLLSETDIECLDEAISEYGTMSFGRLKSISHDDAAFLSADEDDFISLEAIAASLPNADELLDYLRNT